MNLLHKSFLFDREMIYLKTEKLHNSNSEILEHIEGNS